MRPRSRGPSTTSRPTWRSARPHPSRHLELPLLDFIPIGLARKVDATMQPLGFEKTERHWTHPKSRYWVEFSPGPVAIGEDTIRDFAEREARLGTLRLLAPTECVMDRLAWYFHDADTQCLEQAVEVAMRRPVALERIERWARGERPHGEERFCEFEQWLRESAGASLDVPRWLGARSITAPVRSSRRARVRPSRAPSW
jgi:hypothetical protein